MASQHMLIKTNVTTYVLLQELGSGTYGRVLKAHDQNDPSKIYAIKIFNFDENEDEGVPATSIRELDIVKNLRHPNVVKIYDVYYSRPPDRSPVLVAVFELCSDDLKKHCKAFTLSMKDKFSNSRTPIKEHIEWAKDLMFQLLNGMAYCHSNKIMHRDLKPQNILMGFDKKLKIADFGLARACRLPIPEYTHDVLTLWYRAPEILLGAKTYSPSVDVWSAGCIMAEFFRSGHALFAGDCEIDMVFRIFRALGTPTEDDWPDIGSLRYFENNFPVWKKDPIESLSQHCRGLDELGLELLSKLLHFNPVERITCREALLHPWFDDLDKSKYQLWDCNLQINLAKLDAKLKFAKENKGVLASDIHVAEKQLGLDASTSQQENEESSIDENGENAAPNAGRSRTRSAKLVSHKDVTKGVSVTTRATTRKNSLISKNDQGVTGRKKN